MHEDEFCLDPTRMTLVCGTAGFDGTQFKELMADDYDIQFNKTSRNSVLLQSNINNTRSDVAQLIRVLLRDLRRDRGPARPRAARTAAQAFAARVKSLMTDVPDLPNFSHFHEAYPRRRGRAHARGRHAHAPSTAPTTPRAASTCRSTAPNATSG